MRRRKLFDIKFMRLPLAIHAARQGYAWLNKSQHDFVLIERFRKAIGKMPDIDYGEPLSSGALNIDEWVVVYRFMIEKSGDFRGRDCLYLAMTYFQRAIAATINIESLLKNQVFTKPMVEPPNAFEYEAGESLTCLLDVGLLLPNQSSDLSYACAGTAFQQSFAGLLRFTQEDGSSCRVSYQPAGVLSTSEPEPSVANQPLPAPSCVENVAPVLSPCRWSPRASWLAASAVLLLMAGMLDKFSSLQCGCEKRKSKTVSTLSLSPIKHELKNTFFCLPGCLDMPRWDERTSLEQRQSLFSPPYEIKRKALRNE